MPVFVRNVKGREPDPPKCGCGTWIKHWENNSKAPLSYCCATGCFQKAEVGGHVQRLDIDDNSWFIIPICGDHNKGKFGQEYYVEEDDAFLLLSAI